MITVHTEQELIEALERKMDEPIKLEGPDALTLAQKIQDSQKMRERREKSRMAIAGSLLAVTFGLVAAPFTGGISLAGSAAGITALAGSAVGVAALGLTIGTVTLTAQELAIILGSALIAYALYKGYKIVISKGPNGPFIIFTPQK